MKSITVMLGALVLVLGAHAVTRAEPPAAAPAPPAATPTWEYISVHSAGSTGLDAVNAAGKEGWRLVVKQDGWHVMERARK
jgi:hypothetical protein